MRRLLKKISRMKSKSLKEDHNTIVIDHSDMEKKPSGVEGQAVVTGVYLQE